jgi:hypothetical protein
MSAKPWSTVAAPPYGFRITIERRNRLTGKLEEHTFTRKTPNRSIAHKAAEYKYGFLNLLSCEPLTRKEFEAFACSWKGVAAR